MELAPTIKTLPPAAQQEILAVYNKLKTHAKLNGSTCTTTKESLADLLNQHGLHDESRNILYELIEHANSLPDKSRLLRKVAASYTAQRQYFKALDTAEQALTIFRRTDQNTSNLLDFFETLSTYAFANYFTGRSARLEEIIKEMRAHFQEVDEPSVKLRFYFVVMLGILLRHRWYMLPEESITHGEFYLKLALETKNWNTIGSAYSGLGFVHLWREEFDLARKNFEKALELLDNRNFDLVLTSQVYMAVSYRMQNNISMTEVWANIGLDVALKTGNFPYLSLSYGNLAWVYAKRNNMLYAEDYARKAIELPLSYPHPLSFLCIFPLLDCLNKKHDFEEAGMYCYLLLNPGLKAFSKQITQYIELMNAAWVGNNIEEMQVALDHLLTEAKLANYF